MAESLMADEAEEVVKAVVDKAKKGDMTAARIILDRLAPVRRGRPVAIDLPQTEGAEGIAQAYRALTEALAKGDVTPEEAGAVAGVLEAQRKAIETLDLEMRLTALEEAANR